MKVKIKHPKTKDRHEDIFVKGNLVESDSHDTYVIVVDSEDKETSFTGVNLNGAFAKTWSKTAFHLFNGKIILTQ